MDPSIAAALAVNLVADKLCAGRAPNEVIVLCVCCYNDQDPRWEWSVRRAPASAECQVCIEPERAAEGMLFVVRPRR